MNQSTELLYRFHKELNQSFRDPQELLSRGLEMIAHHLKLDQISFFEWLPLESILAQRLVWRGEVTMDIEEEIHVPEQSPLRSVLQGTGVYLSQDLAYPALYVPVQWKGLSKNSGLKFEGAKFSRIGALRMERLNKSWTFSSREKELAQGLAEELSHNMSHADMDRYTKDQLQRAHALTELTGVFASSLRRDDAMKLILQGIQKYFGFDRVRLYLVNQEEQKLKGELSVDVRGHVRSLAHEQIPLQPGSHLFADIALANNSQTIIDKYRDTVVYIPLMVQGKTSALLIVDNLMFQQPIRRDDLTSLSSFAGQIALALDNAMLFDKVQDLSQYDELTKLPLRRYFNERFQEEMYRAERFGQPMALVWIDVDYFKEVNDTYGHQIGDVALKEISRVIMANLRKIDFPCRYGGDEILILLPQARAADARRITTRLSQEIAEIRIPVPFAKTGELHLSASLGAAVYPEDAKTTEELMQRADETLYWVKSKCKGKAALYGDVLGPGASQNPPILPS